MTSRRGRALAIVSVTLLAIAASPAAAARDKPKEGFPVPFTKQE